MVQNGSRKDAAMIKLDLLQIRIAQQSYDYAVNNPRQSGMNRM